MTRKYLAITLCLGIAASLAGCSWSSPFSSKKTTSDAFGDGTTRDLSGNSDGYFTKTFKQAGAAMTPKATVEKAADPTSLTSKPGVMGPDLHLTAARQYENQGQFLKAEEHYRKALEIAPKDTSIQIAYARLLHREGKIPQAVQVYQAVLAVNPNSAVALNDLGLCYARHGQIEAARQSLARAVQLKPESKLYCNNFATVLVEANMFDEAFTQLQAAHGEAGACHNMGFLMRQHGSEEQAAQFFARAAQLDPALAATDAPAPQESGRLHVETVAETRTGGATYYVGDANAAAAPYRLPQSPNRAAAAAANNGGEIGVSGEAYPTQAPPVMVDRS